MQLFLSCLAPILQNIKIHITPSVRDLRPAPLSASRLFSYTPFLSFFLEDSLVLDLTLSLSPHYLATTCVDLA